METDWSANLTQWLQKVNTILTEWEHVKNER
jgi:hypothetical protein